MKNSTRNASSMKLGNMLDIINIIRQEPVSRADVARAMGLTRAAITIIVDRLERDGILFERGMGTSRKGKRPILLDIKNDSFYFMGVDITRVNCSIGITDIKGKTVAQTGFDLHPGVPFDSVLPAIAGGMRSVYDELARPDRLRGIGVSVPGPVDFRSGVALNPPNFKMLQGQNVLDKLNGVLDICIWLENNAVARTLYEKNLGLGRRFQNFMVMIVDTGIGSGLVLDGRLYRGVGYAGEAGHTSLNMAGERCACGNRGCLELYAAIPALLRRECAGQSGIASWKDVVDRAEAGDEWCLSVIRKEARYLAQSIVNTDNLLDLQAVILTGYVAYNPELLLDLIRRFVQGARITGAVHDLEILASVSQQEAGMASAAMIAMDKFLSGQTGWSLPA